MLSKLLLPFTNYRYLLYQLTQREIKARYKQSFVGYAWVLLNPLAQLAVYSFVFSMVFRFPAGGVAYPLFLFTALLPWTMFQNSISHATQSLVQNASLLRIVAFPREVIPYSVVFSKVIDFLFSLIVFLFFVVIFKANLHASAWIFIPLFLVQLVLTMGISLGLAVANLFYRDIQYLTNLVLMLWMYMTPVVYPLSMVPMRFLWLYKLNPMVGIIEGYRAALFGSPFEPTIIWWSAGVSAVIFIISFLLFKRAEKTFADIV
jgi:lipopolysaccharide transport system permease protein